MADMTARIKVEGLASFKTAMSQAAGAVKAATAEEKLAEAQYKATGDAAAYQQQKTAALTTKLQAQKAQVDAARQACEKLEKAGVAPDDSRLVTWRTKLTQAKTAVTQTETELAKLNAQKTDDVQREMGELTTAAKNTGTSLAGIATKFDRKTLIEGIDAVTDKMEGLMKGAARAGQAVFEAGSDAASWADGIRDSAVAAHMSTEEYQRMRYAAQFFGTSVEQIAGQQAKITKAMAGGEALEVGSRSIETAGRRWSDVMWDVLEGLGEIPDEAERDAAAMEIFGKGYKELNGLIAGGRDAWNERYNEAPVVSENSINSLADAADAIKDMDARLETLKMETLTALAPALQTIANAVGDLAQNLTDFLQTEEGQQLMKDLAQAIADVVSALTGEGDFAGIVDTAKKALEGLTQALGWLADHKDAVAGAITAIVTAFTGLKVVSAGLNLMNMIDSAKNLLGGGAGAAAAGGGASAAGGGGSAAGGAGLAGKIASLGTGGELSAILGPAALVGAVYGAGRILNEADAATIQARTEQTRQTAREAAAMIGEGADDMLNAVEMAADALGVSDRKSFDGQTILGDPAAVTRTLQAFQQYSWLQDILDPETWNQLQAIGTDASTLSASEETDLLQTVTDAVVNRMTAEAAGETPSTTPEAAFRAMKGRTDLTGGDVGDLMDVQDWFIQDGDEGLTEEGRAAIEGFTAGMKEAEPEAVAEATAMAQAVKNAVAEILDINSPSRVMMSMGRYAVQGFAEGIEASIAQISAAASRMAASAAAPAVSLAGAGVAGAGSSYNRTLNIGTYNASAATDVAALARQVVGVQKADRQAFGRRK